MDLLIEELTPTESNLICEASQDGKELLKVHGKRLQNIMESLVN